MSTSWAVANERLSFSLSAGACALDTWPAPFAFLPGVGFFFAARRPVARPCSASRQRPARGSSLTGWDQPNHDEMVRLSPSVKVGKQGDDHGRCAANA
jgi:hypothetical protein